VVSVGLAPYGVGAPRFGYESIGGARGSLHQRRPVSRKSGWQQLPAFVPLVLAASVVATFLFLRTRFSLPLVCAFHGMARRIRRLLRLSFV
jgi:hypothetical protein